MECPHKVVSCELCNLKVKAGDLEGHGLVCPNVELDCPHGCECKVLRGSLLEHEIWCGNVVVDCAFVEHGCKERGKRKRIAEHEEDP
eukprot:996115-Rhodomonas_salina.1